MNNSKIHYLFKFFFFYKQYLWYLRKNIKSTNLHDHHCTSTQLTASLKCNELFKNHSFRSNSQLQGY